MPDASVRLCYAHLMVVSGVPYGTGLIRDGAVDLILLGSIECGTQCYYLREYGYVIIADSVAGLVPPVVGGNIQTVNRD